jgi:hypothetical protein
MGTPAVMERWHRIVEHGDMEALEDLLADDVVFHSPVVHTPQEGKPLAKLYLTAAYGVFAGSGSDEDGRERTAGPGKFRYVREIVGDHDAMLEFVTEIDGIVINGVDIVRWNDDDRIVDFKVMIRPLKAINLLHQMMARMLDALKTG